jgi:hypothetical protein
MACASTVEGLQYACSFCFPVFVSEMCFVFCSGWLWDVDGLCVVALIVAFSGLLGVA